MSARTRLVALLSVAALGLVAAALSFATRDRPVPLRTATPAMAPIFGILNTCLTSADPMIFSTIFGASMPFIAISTSSSSL